MEKNNIFQNAYFVDIKFKGKGTGISLNPEALGINLSDKEMRGFFSSYVRNGELDWAGKNNLHVKKAQAIAKRVHRMKRQIALDGESFIPEEKLSSLLKYIEEQKKLYYKEWEELLTEYDHLTRRFTNLVKQDLLKNTLHTEKVEENTIYKQIMASIPTPEEIKSSIDVVVGFRKFSLATDFDAEELKEIQESATLEQARLINGHTVKLIINPLLKLAKAKTKGSLTENQKEMGKKALKEIKERNVFQNKDLEKLKDKLEGMIDSYPTELLEEGVILSWKLAKEFQVDEEINLKDSIYDKETLNYLVN